MNEMKNVINLHSNKIISALFFVFRVRPTWKRRKIRLKLCEKRELSFFPHLPQPNHMSSFIFFCQHSSSSYLIRAFLWLMLLMLKMRNRIHLMCANNKTTFQWSERTRAQQTTWRILIRKCPFSFLSWC